jgi:pimeloyl-ACP methyl ester carboxylesterase
MRIERFRVYVPEDVIDDLTDRLARTRWPDQIGGPAWRDGSDLDYMRSLVEYWRTRYDWRAQEQDINRFAHFRADIDGLGVHFIHERGKGPAPLPLIITHGWPGSFVEMLKIIPMLVDPASHGGDPADSFDVVVPSMIGYGFSDRPLERGMTSLRMAQIWQELMTGLGYRRFGAQGGDWGAAISTWMALRWPERVVGLHLNYIPGSYQPHLGPGSGLLSEVEEAFLKDREKWRWEEGAYGHIQSTRPQTVAYGLNDSPSGLAAWIVEKFRTWGDCNGDVERCFTKDELLTNITIYWATQTINSSIRLYREAQATLLAFQPDDRVKVPCGIARFPVEAPFPPREWIERGYNIAHWTDMPRGGHFAAMEQPELLADDIRKFFRPLRG